MSLTCTRLQVAVRVMPYYNSVPFIGAVQTTRFTGGYDYRC